MSVRVTFQLRRDTAANWTSNNPVLKSGEPGIETDTSKAKLGDGLTAWTSLGYWNPGDDLALAGGVLLGALGPAVATIADAATVVIPAAEGNHFRVTIEGDRLLGQPTGGYDGQLVLLDVTQDTVGGRTLSYADCFDFGNPPLTPVLSSGAGAEDTFGLQYNEPAETWKVLAFAPGYAS